MQEIKIEKPKKAASKKRDYWEGVVDEWKQSNERQEIFCGRKGIKIGTFTHWRSVFSRENKQKGNKFIPVKIISTDSARVESFTIETPTGYKITIPFVLDTAKQLFALLGITHA